MKHPILNWACGAAMLVWLSMVPAFAGTVMNKTLRVEHGRPVIVVSQKGVLLIEFVKEPIAAALVPHTEPDIRHCRANYRYRFYDSATGAVTNGQGTVEEVYQRLDAAAGGHQVKDVGSHVGISAGDFYLWWSEGSAGARSWLYYRTDAPIRFVQQPAHVSFEAVDLEQLRGYLVARNVQEFLAAGRTVQVIGPAVFSGDLPTDTPTLARVESGQVRDGGFEVKLTNLATNKHYIIESSYEVKSGSWTPVHTFLAAESNHTWTDPLGKDVDLVFYRIREGAY